jgi:galactokinase
MAVPLLEQFVRLYGSSDQQLRVFAAPGRVNLIGEHLDYNGGLVLPAAITLGVTAMCRLRPDRVVHLHSLEDEYPVEIDLDRSIEHDDARGWGNYPAGVLRELAARGIALPGADVLFSSTLPQGAGLSSSAAIEVVTAFSFLRLSGAQEMGRTDLALLCQKVENQFVGVNCGIMDQFAVAQGRENSALLLDCGSLEYRVVPVVLGEYALVIMNTSHRRELTDSKYNERRAECDAVAALLGPDIVRRGLAHATWDEVLTHVADPVLRRRARHVITEQARVVEAARVLATGDLVAFGQLLTASHASLRDDYEVTGLYLDAIVDAALAAPGCLGARMTGAGFGGCALALVRQDAMEKFTDSVHAVYMAATGLEPSFRMTHPADGVHELYDWVNVPEDRMLSEKRGII